MEISSPPTANVTLVSPSIAVTVLADAEYSTSAPKDSNMLLTGT